jgi:Asp-tRNA(Asn)/Glu-tRNA(Gln) amidotransferase A subunit family amidase
MQVFTFIKISYTKPHIEDEKSSFFLFSLLSFLLIGMNLSTASLTDMLAGLRDGTLTHAQIWEHFDHVTAELDDELQSYNFRTKEKPEATEGPLAGLPLAIKDVYSETGVPTTASSKMLENYIAPYESTATKRLKEAGMVSLGKVNHDEFAMGATGENSALRISRNPWDTSRVPGGSSSGSSVAVASGMAPVSIATDTGGSIRQPASLTGVVGFKWTYGTVSRYGVIPMASSLDTMGVLSRTVRDAHLVWDAMQGHDPLDATTLDGRIEVSPEILESQDLKWVKIGLPKEYFGEGIEAGTREVIEQAKKTLTDLGAELIEVSLPSTDYALAAYYVIVPSEVSSNLARFDGIRFGHITGEEFRDYADWISHTRSQKDSVQKQNAVSWLEHLRSRLVSTMPTTTARLSSENSWEKNSLKHLKKSMSSPLLSPLWSHGKSVRWTTTLSPTTWQTSSLSLVLSLVSLDSLSQQDTPHLPTTPLSHSL